jgi:hypothetical protein
VSLVKSALRKAVRAARSWLQEPTDPLGEEERRFPSVAYGRLNRKLLEIHRPDTGLLRPVYTWGVLQAAHLGRALGYPAISLLEFGVAGGNGLVALERAAEKVSQAFGIALEVYGFDTGKGLPEPKDYRDLPNLFRPGSYRMNVSELESRLGRAKLILGPINETLQAFLAGPSAPIGFAAIDVDLYSSTVQTLGFLEASQNKLLPRIHCYFDDILGCTCADFNGERLAIQEFNDSHSCRKISKIYGLSYCVPEAFARQSWPEKIFMAHVLDHDLYGRDDGFVDQMREESLYTLRTI